MCETHDHANEPDERPVFECRVCGCETGESAFEHVDDEFNPRNPTCPDCQREARLRGQICEFCDEPAEYETDTGPLCDYHHSHYVAGFVSRDD